MRVGFLGGKHRKIDIFKRSGNEIHPSLKMPTHSNGLEHSSPFTLSKIPF